MMLKMFKSFVKDESGLETVEYAVMLALIVVALVLAVQGLSGAVSGKMDQAASVVSGS